MSQASADTNLTHCQDCPHVVGDIFERDCGFPDCRGDQQLAEATRMFALRDLLRWLQATERRWADQGAPVSDLRRHIGNLKSVISGLEQQSYPDQELVEPTP